MVIAIKGCVPSFTPRRKVFSPLAVSVGILFEAKHKGPDTMKLLLYSKKAETEDDPLRHAIESVLPANQIEMCSTFEYFFHRLHQPTYDLMAAVLVAENHADLSNLVSIRDLLADLCVLLVLPDQHPQTIAAGFRLWPRFMCEAQDNYTDIGRILRKLIQSRPPSVANEAILTPDNPPV